MTNNTNQLELDDTDRDMEMTELSEDMEMVSPGTMLKEARAALSLSQQHIAKKLNFTVSLVNNLENDTFDSSLPTTFNRGYLVNYAKLVDVDVEDILASYDVLDAANIQRSEMLSFSKSTTKQAEQSRVIWISYLIVALLVGLTILWYLQENDQQKSNSANNVLSNDAEKLATQAAQGTTSQDTNDAQQVNEINKTDIGTSPNQTSTAESATTVNKETVESKPVNEPVAELSESTAGLTLGDAIVAEVKQDDEPEISTAVFTFSGDCWVNIVDATGERIAWGMKKSGYVMTITGQAPLKITVGKPELTSIVFNGEAVDMSSFNVGNIAKFNLPNIVE